MPPRPTLRPLTLRDLVSAGQLAELRWPNFADYRNDVEGFYEASGFEGAWSRDGQPTPQALAIIEVLQRAQEKGLNPEDYDASRWTTRLQQLTQPGVAARFDVALTVCLMRYVSDLHIGRLNPKQVKFEIAERNSRYDLAQFLRQDLVTGTDINAELNALEPRFQGYQRTRTVLNHYLELARRDKGAPLPVPAKALDAGSHYAGVPGLDSLLRLLGDLPADAAVPTDELYQSPLGGCSEAFSGSPWPHPRWAPGGADREAAEYAPVGCASGS